MLLLQATRLAFSLALANTGSRRAARTAMIAMTTSNSMRVKATHPASRNLRFKKVCINGFLSGTVTASASTGRMATRKVGEVVAGAVLGGALVSKPALRLHSFAQAQER